MTSATLYEISTPLLAIVFLTMVVLLYSVAKAIFRRLENQDEKKKKEQEFKK